MQGALRRVFLFLLPFLFLLAAGPALKAYPVSITINVTFSDIPGQPDPLGFGTTLNPPTATIMASVESSVVEASYPATVLLSLPGAGINNLAETGTLSINADGTITANFSSTAPPASFSAVLALEGVTFPVPVPTAFGTANFSSPASTVTYNLLGAIGTVGVTGSISAVGLTASPASLTPVTYQIGGTAPAAQVISVNSNTPTGYSVAIGPGTNNSSTAFLTLSSTGGTTPGTVTATFSTSVAAGTYTAAILINTTADSTGAPISIPVTYTVTPAAGGGGSPLVLSPSSLNLQFFLPASTSQTVPVTVSSTGAAQAYTVTVSSGSFLSVSPASGTTTGTVNVTANPAGLIAGTYTGSILFTPASGTAISLPVSVTVTGSGTGSPVTLNPTALTFSYVIGQAVPPAQAVSVSSPTPVQFTVTSNSFFLPVTPASGTTPSSFTVSLNPSTLGGGNFSYNVAVNVNGTITNLPVSILVTSALPTALTAAPSSLTFAYPLAAGASLTQSISITGSSTVAAVTQASWLTINTQPTTTGDLVTVTVNNTAFAPGTLTGSIVLSAPGLASITIPVTLTISGAATPVLTATPTAVAFAYQTGGAALATQTVALATGVTGSAYTATAVGGSWLSVALSTDMTTATLTANPAGLSPGVYVGSVEISGAGISNSPFFVPVTLTVAAGLTLGASPTALTFNAQPGGATPAVQTLAIAGSSTQSFTVVSDSSWLTVTPANGSTPGLLTVTATPGALAAGIYQGNLVITASGGSPLSSTVPVTLNVSAAVSAPVLTAITNGISFVGQVGAPGLVATLWGQGLGPVTAAPLQLSSSTTVSSSIGGTQVFVDGIPCPILFSSSTQVNVVLPFALQGATSATVQLQYEGVSSNVLTLPIQTAAPGLFSTDSTGQNGGAILNQDLSLNSASNPAAAGTIVVIYGGGGGATNPYGSDGLLVPVVAPYPTPTVPGTVTIGGQPATIQYYGDAPGLVSGILQINAVVPAGTPSGPQPVVLTVGAFSSQPNLNVYVQ